MLLSGTLYAVMGLGAYAAHQREPQLGFLSVSAVRVLMNWFLLSLFASSQVRPDRREFFWLAVWGVSGAICVTTYFASVARLGAGPATFLQAVQSPAIALAAPWVLLQRQTRSVWLCIGGSLLGLYFVLDPKIGSEWDGGKGVALLSGLAAAVGYLSLAKVPKASPKAILLSWCVCSTVAHTYLILHNGTNWPTAGTTWGILALTGGSAALGLYFACLSFQRGPAGKVAALSNLTPALVVIGDVVFFGRMPDLKGTLGILLILACGVALSFARSPVVSKMPELSEERLAV